MTGKTQKDQLQEVYQAVLGVVGSEDKGLVGDVKEIVKLVKEQNGRTRRLSTRVNIMWGIIFILTSGVGFSIARLLGV